MKTYSDLLKVKDKVQNKALDIWIKYGYNGVLQIATGVGKTRIGIMAINKVTSYVDHLNVLVIVPTINLRDNEWNKEIEKWGITNMDTYLDIQCVQTAYKYIGKEYDLVIVDEIHTMLTKERVGFFKKNKVKKLLGLTATLNSNQKTFLNYINSKIDFVYDIHQAELDGVISKCITYNFGVNLTKEEQEQYNLLTEELHECINYINNDTNSDNNEKHISFHDNPVIICQRIINGIIKGVTKEQRNYAIEYLEKLNVRKKVYQEAHNKKIILNELLLHFINNEEVKKIIVFSENINSLEEFYSYYLDNAYKDNTVLYHSKQKPKEKIKNLDDFVNDDNTYIMLSAKALNAGFNLPEIGVGISLSGNSTTLDNIQRQGRIRRVKKNGEEVSTYINLYSKDTTEKNNVKQRNQSIKNRWITTINELL